MCNEIEEVETFYQTWQPQVWAYIQKYIGDTEGCSIVIQQVFDEWNNRPEKVSISKPSIRTWLILCSKKLITNYLHSIYGKESKPADIF